MIVPCEAFTMWGQLITHYELKSLNKADKITQRLIQRNGTYLSMSGYSYIPRGPLAASIVHDGEVEEVEGY